MEGERTKQEERRKGRKGGTERGRKGGRGRKEGRKDLQSLISYHFSYCLFGDPLIL